VYKLVTQTLELLFDELGNSLTIDAHGVRTHIKMSIVLSGSNEVF